jgi:hypothetical protein
MYRTNRNWAVIRLLLQLKAYEDDYPNNLFSMRRSYFVMLIYRILSVFCVR